jgi:hypothetical protein
MDEDTSAPEDAEVVEEHVNGTTRAVKTHVTTTPEWRLAVIVGVVVTLHVCVHLHLS